MSHPPPPPTGEPLGPAADPAPRPPAALTEREAEVVRHIALGYGNKEIAARLKLSIKTVETYKSRAMGKIGIKSRVALVQYAIGRGWLTRTEPEESPPASG